MIWGLLKSHSEYKLLWSGRESREGPASSYALGWARNRQILTRPEYRAVGGNTVGQDGGEAW